MFTRVLDTYYKWLLSAMSTVQYRCTAIDIATSITIDISLHLISRDGPNVGPTSVCSVYFFAYRYQLSLDARYSIIGAKMHLFCTQKMDMFLSMHYYRVFLTWQLAPYTYFQKFSNSKMYYIQNKNMTKRNCTDISHSEAKNLEHPERIT